MTESMKLPISIDNFDQYDQFKSWLSLCKEQQNQSISFIDFASSQEWRLDEHTGDLVHRTGKFFSIKGTIVQISGSINLSYTQPFIFQPEIGILGIICKVFNGEPLFLLQAKTEPGNKAGIQLSPTVQATRSNFTGVHGGKSIKYLDYFLEANRGVTIVDSLQPEQSDRFMHKKNRNIVVLITDELVADDEFYWLSLKQIKMLLTLDNLVSMDTRSVISNLLPNQSCIDSFILEDCSMPFVARYQAQHDIYEVQSWLSQCKVGCMYNYKKIGLNSMDGWILDKDKVSQISQGSFSIKQCLVQSNSREVREWDQPILVSERVGLIGLAIRRRGSSFDALCHARRSIGHIDQIEISPTVISDCSDSLGSDYVGKWFIDAINNGRIWHKSIQSEEGGRFFHYENEYVIVESTKDEIHRPDLKWIDIYTLLLCSQEGMVNMELRTLISVLWI